MMQLAAMIFDLDGTLADNFPVVMEAYRSTFKRYNGRTYTDQDIVAMFGPNVEGIIQRAVPDRWQDAVATFYQRFDALYADHDPTVPGMANALTALTRKGVRQAVVTGGSQESANVTLKHLGLSNYFERIETGSAHGDRKAEAIAQVVADFGLEPSQAAYLGDAPQDVIMARQAGVLPLSAAWSSSAIHFLDDLKQTQPARLFEDVADFHAWIDHDLTTAT